MKQKSMQQSSFKSAAIKTTLFFTSAFFAAHTVFGTPKITTRAQAGRSGEDSIAPTSQSIYIRLSVSSPQAAVALQNQANTELQALTSKCDDPKAIRAMSVPSVLQVLANYSKDISTPELLDKTVSNLKTSLEGLERWCKQPGDEWLSFKLNGVRTNLAVLRALQSLSEGQKAIILKALCSTKFGAF